MKWCRLLLVAVVPTALAVPAQAGIFFGKKARPNPAERVPVLIMTLKTEPNEHKRASAASELRQFDTNLFPEIVPVLVEAALHDPKSSVRLDAVESLGRIRPVSQQAGWALEQVLAHEANLRVRLEARTSLWHYHVSGYHGSMQGEPPVAHTETVTTSEPPLDTTATAPPPAPAQQPLRPVPVMTPASAPESMPAQPVTAIPVGQPLPAGPPQPPVTPMEPPLLETPPSSDGPDLNPPQ
jgi:hypothetical protein